MAKSMAECIIKKMDQSEIEKYIGELDKKIVEENAKIHRPNEVTKRAYRELMADS